MTRKRSAYRPRILHVPITGGIVQAFDQSVMDMEIHLLMGPSAANVEDWLRMMNAIALAAESKGLDRAAVVRIRSAALHLVSMNDRGQATGSYRATLIEAEQVRTAIADMRKLLPRLDVASLIQAYRAVVVAMAPTHRPTSP